VRYFYPSGRLPAACATDKTFLQKMMNFYMVHLEGSFEPSQLISGVYLVEQGRQHPLCFRSVILALTVEEENSKDFDTAATYVVTDKIAQNFSS
jgi:hypothetical protein